MTTTTKRSKTEPFDKDLKFGYFRVDTPKGMGVVCIALKRPPKDSGSTRYDVGISYYSPMEDKAFDKSIARNISLGRLNSGNSVHRFSLDIPRTEGQKLSDVFQVVLDHVSTTRRSDSSSNCFIAPRWLVKARATGNVRFGLRAAPATCSDAVSACANETGYVRCC